MNETTKIVLAILAGYLGRHFIPHFQEIGTWVVCILILLWCVELWEGRKPATSFFNRD
jgi:hypothetical protein